MAAGQVHPGNMMNGCPLPPGYAVVTLDTLAKDETTQLSWKRPWTMIDQCYKLTWGPWWHGRSLHIVLVATMSECISEKDVELTNPMPTPALPPISENGEPPHKV